MAAETVETLTARVKQMEKAFDHLMDLYSKKGGQYVAECKRSATLERQLKEIASRPPKDDEDVLQAVCAGQFFLLYRAWYANADITKAFADIVPEAAEQAKYMMELNDMCSGEMFGHKEGSR